MKRGSSRQKLSIQRENLHQGNSDGDSSLSSLGSLPEATSVTKHFLDDLPSQRRFTTHITAPPSKQNAPARNEANQPPRAPRQNSRNCPHCQKRFTNAWAIPKHVSRVHDRSGELHCPKCTYKTRSKERLDAHDRSSHRTCPYCKKVFLFLDRHADTCPKKR